VLASLLDQRRNFAPFEIIEPSPHQQKAFARQIFNGRRKIQLAVEPGFYSVLIGADDVHQVVGLERPHVAGEDIRGNTWSLEGPGTPPKECQAVTAHTASTANAAAH